MIKIMHIADIHFETKSGELSPDKSEIRRREIKETFSKSIDIAIKEDVKIILIAGDVFDSDYIGTDTIEFLKREFERIKDIYVFISPGNHDPYTMKAYSALKENLSGNVKIFENRLEGIEIKELNTRVFGYGFEDIYVKESVLSSFKAPCDDMINLCVIHADLSKESDYNPLTNQDILNSNLNYIALGHTHTFSGVLKSGNTYYAYPGTMEPHGFDETGSKGVIIGNIGKNECLLEFLPVSKRQYNVIDIDISDCEIFEDVSNKIKQALTAQENLYKITFVGEKSENLSLNLKMITELFENDVFFVKFKDDTVSKVDINEIAKEFTLKGICAKKIIENTNEENKEFYQKVFKYLLELF
ncbi:MAG: DNA repair exonuclease [Ruminococcaceae bacterium]|nr:DNA repair exonuclease [Oscillospiraceae bacterium]